MRSFRASWGLFFCKAQSRRLSLLSLPASSMPGEQTLRLPESQKLLGASRYDVHIRGGRGLCKSWSSKGGCVNFIISISSKWEQGEGVKQSEIFVDIIYGSPLRNLWWQQKKGVYLKGAIFALACRHSLLNLRGYVHIKEYKGSRRIAGIKLHSWTEPFVVGIYN